MPRTVWCGLVALALAWVLSPWVFKPNLLPNLNGKVALVTGGSRGAGRGFTQALVRAGATVYVTGRSLAPLKATCAAVEKGAGRCVPRAVDSRSQPAVEELLREINGTHGGRLDVLVNNAYSAIGYWDREKLLGRPFWETPLQLYDEVFEVGVRAHYAATQLAIPMLQRAGGGLVVHTNSPGCLVYFFSVAYGMGKCAVDKMAADMGMELADENIAVVSWWPGAPLQSDEVHQGVLDGPMQPRRGMPPGMHAWVRNFSEIQPTALSTTLRFEGEGLVALARDPNRMELSGLAVTSSMAGNRYHLLDERGLQPPSPFSIKYQLCLLVPWLWDMIQLPVNQEASELQWVLMNIFPDLEPPLWMFKVLSAPPLSFQWPLS